MQNANHASGFSRFSWSADSREEDKTWKKEREREGTWSAEADITEQPLHTHCGHPASLLFHAAKYRVLFTRRFQPRRWKLAVGPRNGASYSSCVDKNGRLCDGIFPPLLSFPLSKFSFFLPSGIGRGTNFKCAIPFLEQQGVVESQGSSGCNGINFFLFHACTYVYCSHGVMKK